MAVYFTGTLRLHSPVNRTVLRHSKISNGTVRVYGRKYGIFKYYKVKRDWRWLSRSAGHVPTCKVSLWLHLNILATTRLYRHGLSTITVSIISNQQLHFQSATFSATHWQPVDLSLDRYRFAVIVSQSDIKSPIQVLWRISERRVTSRQVHINLLSLFSEFFYLIVI